MSGRGPYAVKHDVCGEKLTIKEAADKYGLGYFTIIGRMRRLNLTVEEAVKYVPVKKPKPPIDGRKPWRKMTNDEIFRLKKQKCAYCKYRSGTEMTLSAISMLTCDYVAKEHKCRWVDPRDCELWREGDMSPYMNKPEEK